VSGQHKPPQSREPWPWQKAKPASHAKRSSGGTGSGSGGGSRRSKTPAKPPKSRFRVWFRRFSFAGLAGFGLLAVAFAVAYARTDIPDPNREFQAETSYVYYDDGKTVLGKFATQDRDSVDLDAMGQHTPNAVIAAEDRTFYTNKGIDPKGIIRAAFSNARGNSTQGASTITQQYVKVLYLTQERSYKRKIKEAFVSLKLQNEVSKDEILEGYLNTIYFGRGAYGIEAAARAYFGVSATQLTLKQSAALAAVINSPNNYDPAKGPAAKAALFSRYLYVLDGMSDMGSINAADYDKASRRLPKFPNVRGNTGYVGQNGYIMEMVRDELHKLNYSDAEIDGSGLRITTSINKKVMEAAQAGVLEQRPEGLKQLHVGVASVDPQTGGLKGMYAGAPYEQSNGGTNWAMTGEAPGSTFKAFALAAGLKDGYSLKSTFNGNSPLEVAGIDFNNQGEGGGHSYGSRISLLSAAENSVNTAFVDLTDAMDDGPEKVLDTAVDMGIPRCGRKCGLEPTVGVPLGSADIRPVDMANGYATIADLGIAKKWYVIERIKNVDGANLYKHKVKATRVLEEDVASDVSYALENVVTHGTGHNAMALGRPAAGKTGTATDDEGHVRSSWFVGYTPQLATAVMYVRGDGNDPLEGYMPTFYGGEYPARTWTAMMSRALDGEPVEQFPDPANIKATQTNHAPYTPPPPKPKKTKKPTPTPTPTPTKVPGPPTASPTKQPGPPTPTCTLLQPCDTTSPPGNGNGGGSP